MGQRSRAALQRYLFYCNRYMNHMQSLRFEHKLYAQVKQKMEEMQQHNMSWIEVQFLKKAVDVLCQCRATLMYTYVFAFYLKKNNQSIIFEVGIVTGGEESLCHRTTWTFIDKIYMSFKDFYLLRI